MKFTVLRGRPEPEELAAITAVLLARLQTQTPEVDAPGEREARAGWQAPSSWAERAGAAVSWSR